MSADPVSNRMFMPALPPAAVLGAPGVVTELIVGVTACVVGVVLVVLDAEEMSNPVFGSYVCACMVENPPTRSSVRVAIESVRVMFVCIIVNVIMC